MGRPTKLNEQTHKAIVDAIGLGVTYEAAAGAAGVDYHTFNNWMIAGAAAKSGRYLEFFTAVEQAKAQAQSNFVKVITSSAAKGDWKAAAWYLSRTNRKDFGDALKLDVNSLTDDDIKRIFAIASTGGTGSAEAGHTDPADPDAASRAA